MTFIKLGKKFLKITGIVTGSLVILLALFYWWFIHHAERAIEDVVSLQSNGKLKVEIGKIKYNYGRKLSLHDITFYTVDTADENMGYNFQISQLHLTVKSVRSLIMDKQLLIDSILVLSPNITITRLKKSEERHLSIPEEMGKIYESIEKALQVLEISRFQIDDAKFTLIDKTDNSLQPLTIAKLHLHVDNFKVDTSAHKQRDKFLFADNVVLSSTDQSFMLPDGNHHITYKNFNINIRKKLVEMDSCTITAYRHHGRIPIFRMFVDTMMLTNVDFLALSRHSLIRADSVYLVNSDIRLNIPQDSLLLRKKSKKPFNVQHILSTIASDMQLAYIGVKNSSVNVTTEKDNQTNTFTSSRNNFELYKVVIDTRAEQPVTVEQFLMSIRNYDGYGKDSAYRLQFDSIRFTNNTVRLDNFSITTSPNAKVPARRNYHIPLFELKGLSWQDLLFNRHIIAREAVLHKPVLTYEKLPWKDTADRRSIYELFTVLDTIINLRRISMVDGQLDFKLNSNTRITLANVNGSVNTERLLRATSSGFIESSVESLAFSKGSITTPHLFINMDRAYFEGGSRSLVIRKFKLNHKELNVRLDADDLALQDLLLNDSAQILRIDHMSWKKADVHIDMKSSKSDSASAPIPPLKLFVNGIQLNNTNVDFNRSGQSLKTFIRQAAAGSIIQEPGQALQVNQLHLQGGPLSFAQPGTSIELSAYNIHESQASSIEGILITHYRQADSMALKATSFQFTPFIETAGKGPLRINNAVLNDPEVRMTLFTHEKQAASQQRSWPEMELSSLKILRPVLDIKEHKDSTTTWLHATATANDALTLTNIRTHHSPQNQATASAITWQSGAIALEGSGKDSSLLAVGSIDLHVRDLVLTEASSIKAKALLQYAAIKQFNSYSRNKGNQTRADSLAFTDLHFNTAWLREPAQFFRNSPALAIHHFTGSHTSKTDHFSWQDLNYAPAQKELSLDSFHYTPVASREAYIAAHPFQTDYIQVWTGPILFRNIEPVMYFYDSTLTISSISLQQPSIEVFRDKRPPFQHGIYKPLPTGMIQKIPFPIAIDSILIHDMAAQYSELSDKTLQTGVVHFSHIDAQLSQIKNIDLHHTDSLRLRATAKFLDQIGLQLNMDESYMDSLRGFFLDVHMARAHLPVLNPILEPLASIKVRRGDLDTMILRAVGRDYISLGEMQMKYRNLNIQFLKNGQEKSTFVTRFITWAANHLVLRKHNANKTGTVYFPRFRDRSIFNYWVKMTLSGAASSVGVKKNRKYIKRYNRALKKNELPPIQYFE
ncbi:MAG: hypothetical protein J7578_02530 [Chitinophagaceae bacterium]|nr:hypothetical protein [Chitinophagaceae bacterium]